MKELFVMGHFSGDYITFFEELAKNNNKTWFDQNRKRFEQVVKNPFNAFVEEMIVRIHAQDPDVLIGPAEAIFRIFRDVRFSKDKTPYKTHMSAFISPGGRKSKDKPGFYFQLGVLGIRIYSGVYDVDKEQLTAIRRHIQGNLSAFGKIINNVQFKSHFVEVLGEKHQRIPPEFQETAQKQPLIANKAYYVMADIDKSKITDPSLSELLMTYYGAVKPFLVFLTQALR